MPPPNCGKDSHTYREAQKVIKQMTRTARLKGKTIRSQQIYKCGFCGKHHLTSHSYTQKKPEQRAA